MDYIRAIEAQQLKADVPELQIGDNVKHSVFGDGTITEINRHGNWVVKFKDGSVKSFASSAFDEGFLKIIID